MKLLDEGIKLFKEKEYNEAIKKFRAVPNNDAKFLEAQGYLLLALKASIEERLSEKGKAPAQVAEPLCKEAVLLAIQLLKEDKEGTHQETLTQLQKLRAEIVRRRYYQDAAKTVYPAPEKPAQRVDNLVFQGGDIKGIAYLDALVELSKHIDLNKVKRYGGTSAGAINSLMLGSQYSLDDLKNMLQEIDFALFMDGELRESVLEASQNPDRIKGNFSSLFGEMKSNVSTGASFAVSEYISNPDIKLVKKCLSHLTQNEFGLFPGDYFREGWVEPVIYAKTGIHYATFEELHKLGLPDMSFVGVNIMTGRAEVFSYEITPKMIVSDAVRISMSIPLIFNPHGVYLKNEKGGRVQDINNPALYIDGGVLDNYALWLYDYLRYWNEKCSSSETGRAENPYTLGFRLVCSEKKGCYEQLNNNNSKAQQDNNNANKPAEILKEKPASLGEFVFQIFEAIYGKQESDHVKLGEHERTIYINHLGFKATQFDLGKEDQERLLKEGREAVQTYFKQRLEKNKQLLASLKQAVEQGNKKQAEAFLNTSSHLQHFPDILDTALKQKHRHIIWLLLQHQVFDTTQPEAVRELLHAAKNNEWLDAKEVEEIALKFEQHQQKQQVKADKVEEHSAPTLTLKFA